MCTKSEWFDQTHFEDSYSSAQRIPFQVNSKLRLVKLIRQTQNENTQDTGDAPGELVNGLNSSVVSSDNKTEDINMDTSTTKL